WRKSLERFSGPMNVGYRICYNSTESGLFNRSLAHAGQTKKLRAAALSARGPKFPRIKSMRPDMHKIIVERPRYGGGRERYNRRANVPIEDRPMSESMRAPHTDRKSFGENLAPLRRWLRSQVGRLWDDIYSEACSVIKPDSTVRNHIKGHLLEMVERD